MRRRGFLIGLGTTAVIASPFSAIAQWVTRDHRWPPRGPWNQALPRELPQLFREFNGIDFGHSHLAQTLLETQDPQRVERARLEILDFIFSSPAVPPDEEQVSPTFVRLVWEVQRAFNWAHTFHRSLYDLFASAYEDKPGAYRRLLANYLDKPEAITPSNLDSGARRTRTFQPLVKSARKSDLRRRRQGVGKCATRQESTIPDSKGAARRERRAPF